MGPIARLRQWLTDRIAAILNQPLGSYELHVPNDAERLRRDLRKGDVILIEGDQRVSVVIKYLTQSSWSHVAFYVGDELMRRHPEQADALIGEYGEDANHLIVEALAHGVVLSPISKYFAYNVRVCRPYRLRPDDLARVLDDILARLGSSYDVQHIIDLARYFFPVSLIPRKFRRRALALGRREPTEVICSSMIADAFHGVGFPVMPRIIAGGEPPPPRVLDRLLRRRPTSHRFLKRPPSLITPREFDLSPFFEIVKFNRPGGESFDYRALRWVEDERERIAS